jgi:hypothetical protein
MICYLIYNDDDMVREVRMKRSRLHNSNNHKFLLYNFNVFCVVVVVVLRFHYLSNKLWIFYFWYLLCVFVCESELHI